MKKALLILSLCLSCVFVSAQKVAILQVNQTMNVKKRNIMVDYGEGYDYLKDENNSPVKSEAKAIEFMLKSGWKLVQATGDPGNVASTKYIFTKED